jgi:hypothetical protein
VYPLTRCFRRPPPHEFESTFSMFHLLRLGRPTLENGGSSLCRCSSPPVGDPPFFFPGRHAARRAQLRLDPSGLVQAAPSEAAAILPLLPLRLPGDGADAQLRG